MAGSVNKVILIGNLGRDPEVRQSQDGFKIGFNMFDIVFKQGKIISSNINAELEIKKFIYIYL